MPLTQAQYLTIIIHQKRIRQFFAIQSDCSLQSFLHHHFLEKRHNPQPCVLLSSLKLRDSNIQSRPVFCLKNLMNWRERDFSAILGFFFKAQETHPITSSNSHFSGVSDKVVSSQMLLHFSPTAHILPLHSTASGPLHSSSSQLSKST